MKRKGVVALLVGCSVLGALQAASTLGFRLGTTDKPHAQENGEPVLMRALSRWHREPAVSRVQPGTARARFLARSRSAVDDGPLLDSGIALRTRDLGKPQLIPGSGSGTPGEAAANEGYARSPGQSDGAATGGGIMDGGLGVAALGLPGASTLTPFLPGAMDGGSHSPFGPGGHDVAASVPDSGNTVLLIALSLGAAAAARLGERRRPRRGG